MKFEPRDTSASARDIQEQAHEKLGPEGRLRVAFDLSEAVRELRMAGLRSVKPDAPEAELIRSFVAEVHGLSLETLT
jgi:hypothetical protein